MRLDSTGCCHNAKGSLDRPFSRVLLCLRPAEICKNAIAQELGDVPSQTVHFFGYRASVAPHHRPQFFGVELSA